MSYQPELAEKSPLLALVTQAGRRWWVALAVGFAFLVVVGDLPGNNDFLISAGVGVSVLVGSTPIGLFWLRNYLITAPWMSVLFLAALVIPPLIWSGAQLEEVDRWRYLFIALAAWILYWIKHPKQHMKAVAIGALIWIGFNVGLVVPGLREYESRREEAFALAVEQGDCVPSEDESCNPVERSMIAGAIILGYALNLVTDGAFVHSLTSSRSRDREERGRDDHPPVTHRGDESDPDDDGSGS